MPILAMKELIKLNTDNNGNQSVSAKHLFIFLGFHKSQWARWSKKNIINNPFSVEGEDWEGFDTMANGNPTTDYVLSLEFAKRISMMAKTEKGDEARTYFLECEKKTAKLPELTPLELARMIVKAEEEKLLLQNKIAIDAPKVEYYENVLQSESLLTTTEVAQLIGMSAITFNKQLSAMGIQRRVNGRWVLMAQYLGKDYTKDKTTPYKTDADGTVHTNTLMYWTEKGKEFLLSKFKKIV